MDTVILNNETPLEPISKSNRLFFHLHAAMGQAVTGPPRETAVGEYVLYLPSFLAYDEPANSSPDGDLLDVREFVINSLSICVIDSNSLY